MIEVEIWKLILFAVSWFLLGMIVGASMTRVKR